MIKWYEVIKRYYGLGYYTETELDKFVTYNKITGEEKTEIMATSEDN